MEAGKAEDERESREDGRTDAGGRGRAEIDMRRALRSHAHRYGDGDGADGGGAQEARNAAQTILIKCLSQTDSDIGKGDWSKEHVPASLLTK